MIQLVCDKRYDLGEGFDKSYDLGEGVWDGLGMVFKWFKIGMMWFWT